MASDRRGVQSLLTLGGGVVLAVSVFLPWYGITLTSQGAASAQQNLNSVAQQFGNSALRDMAAGIGNSFTSLVGQQIATVSAHQVLKDISIVLLVLAGVAVLLTMARLVGAVSPQPRGALAAVGLIAVACIAFRLVARPVPQQDFFTLSVSWGAWLALASSVAIVIGDLWPVPAHRAGPASAPGSGSVRSAEPATGPSSMQGPPSPRTGGLNIPPRPPGWS